MKKTSLLGAAMGFAALFSCVFLSSCVNEEYEISEEKLDLEITGFQEGIVLPLGQTSRICIGDLMDLLDPEVADFFKKNAQGAYSIGMKGNYELSNELDFLKDVAGLDGIPLDRDFKFSFVNLDVDGLSFGPYEYPYEKYLSEFIKPLDISIPQVNLNAADIPVSLGNYKPSDDMTLSSLKGDEWTIKAATLALNNVIPEFMQNDTPINLKDVQSGVNIQTFDKFDMSENPLSAEVDFELPALVKSVSDVKFSETSRVKFKVKLVNSFFKSGDLVSRIKMDLSDLFHLKDFSGDVLDAEFVLNEKNGYSIENDFYITGMVVDPENDVKDKDGRKVFSKSISVEPEISLEMGNNLTTTTRLIAQHSGDVNVQISVEFMDFTVSDVVMSTNPIDDVEVDSHFEINIPDINLPDVITGVEEVMFSSGSGFDINLLTTGISSVEGLDLSLEHLEVTFPKEILVSGADASGKLIIEGGSLKNGSLSRHIEVLGLRPAAAQNGKVTFGGEISVKASARVTGNNIHTAQLAALDNVVISVNGVGKMDVEDFKAEFAGIEQNIQVDPFLISQPVSKELAELGKVSVDLEGNPAVVIDLDLPETSLPITASSEGLKITFPKMLVFGDALPESFDKATNVLHLTGKIPSDPIVLPIEKLLIEATRTGDEWFVSDQIAVSGGVAIQPATVTSKDVDALTSPDAKVAFNASISELKPASVGIDEYTATINETFGFEGLDLGSLPKELVSIGFVELNNVYLNLAVKAPELKDIVKDADITFNMDLSLPPMIKVEGGRLENGVLQVTGALDEKGEIVIEPLKIVGLDLSEYDLKAEDPFKDVEIGISGNVKVTNATIDLEALQDATLNLQVDGSIKSADSEDGRIMISKVTGRVDYQIDPVVQTLDLSDVISALNSENLSTQLDINRFNLRLEIESNMKIPVQADISIMPYKGDTPGKPVVLNSPVRLNCPDVSGESAFTRLWISNTDKDMPEGYRFLEVDLISMLKDMPDRIDFTISAGTVVDEDIEIMPSLDYVLKADYAAELPIEFGEDFKFEFTEYIDNLPAELGEILTYGSIAIIGDITSSLPVQLEMRLSLLDSKGQAVELADKSGELVIKSCAPDGSPVTTDLNLFLKIKPGADVSDITSLGLYFKATTKGVSGVPVTEDTFVQASLQALIPNGVTIDLSKYLETDKD